MQLRILNAHNVRQALPMAEAIPAMARAFSQFSAGSAQVPLRSRIEVVRRGGTVLFMPALLEESEELALKVVSVFPENAALELPTIHALVTVVDPETGRPVALIEGGSLTAIRTGAASGAATEALARPDASRLGIFGSGVQARTQFEAACAVRPVEAAWVYSPNRAHAERFAQEMSGGETFAGRVQVAENPAEIVRQADLICTATTSPVPVFDGADLQPGTHINAVGSFTPQMQEVDLETVRRSLVVVDSRQAALAEAGDLIVPLERREIQKDHLHAELGEVLNGTRPGRSDPQQITYFKSVGLAVQDAAAAGLALQRAEQLGLGTVVEL